MADAGAAAVNDITSIIFIKNISSGKATSKIFLRFFFMGLSIFIALFFCFFSFIGGLMNIFLLPNLVSECGVVLVELGETTGVGTYGDIGDVEISNVAVFLDTKLIIPDLGVDCSKRLLGDNPVLGDFAHASGERLSNRIGDCIVEGVVTWEALDSLAESSKKSISNTYSTLILISPITFFSFSISYTGYHRIKEESAAL